VSGRQFELFEDFCGASVSSNQVRTSSGVWTVSGNGTPVATMQSGAADTPGILRLSTSAGVGDTALLALGNSEGFIESQQIELLEFRVRAISTVNFSYEIGIAPIIDVGMGTVGHFVRSDNSDNHLHSVCQQGGADNLDLGVRDGNSVWFTMRMYPANGGFQSRRFAATGSSATAGADHSSNTMTSGTACALGIAIKTIAGGAKHLEIDYIRLRSVELARGGYG
jgi:hypothetical protein